jgi:hypothetical protein
VGIDTAALTRRTRPWIWVYGLIVALYVAAWIGDPVETGAVTLDPVEQLGSMALFVLPATAVVGAAFAFIPPRHRVMRTSLLVPLALYVAGVGALVTFVSADLVCTGGACTTVASSRLIGFAGQSLVWFAGRGAEEIAVAVRVSRRRRP